MLAAHHDQENLAFSHQAGAAAKQQQSQGIRNLQPKTPGARYPKTPLKIPLNDENATHGLGGKSVLRAKNNDENITTMGKGGKSNFVTPLEPRTGRAPLGNKTTNAKALTGQLGGVKQIVREFEQTQAKPNTTKALKHAPTNLESSKLGIHVDKIGPLQEEVEEDIEYAPPKPKDLPYESDVMPDGRMTFEGLKPENILRGYYDYYFNPVDENGVPIREREMEEQRQKDFKKLDEQVKKDMDEFDWSVGDVPETRTLKAKKSATAASEPAEATLKAAKKPAARAISKQPSTITSRRAASALAFVPKPSTALMDARKNIKPEPRSGPSCLLPLRRQVNRPAVTRESSAERAAAVAASRSTLGYSKGRSTSSAIQGSNKPKTPAGPMVGRTLQRSASTASSGSDSTITPARYAQTQASNNEDGETWKKFEFLSIFDVDEEEDGNLGGSVLPVTDGLDDDFQLNVEF